MPPSVVMAPQIRPRAHGCPRPVRLPSSDSASAKPMLMPAPNDAAIPTRKASQLFFVAKAATNTGANVDTEPSISPAKPGCTICKTNSRLVRGRLPEIARIVIGSNHLAFYGDPKFQGLIRRARLPN